MSNSIIYAVAQMTSTSNLEKNFLQVEHLVQKASQQNAHFISIPEAFAFIGESAIETLKASKICAAKYKNKYIKLAKKYNIWISYGGYAEYSHKEEKFFNAHLLINPQGEITHRYDKIHLFDVEIPNGPKLQESINTIAGKQIILAQTTVGKIGLSICYDLRFPELYLKLRNLGAEILLVPAAFTLTTGKEHWHTLLKARAIENQSYVIAAAQTGKHNSKRQSYGHAVIIDPWGTIISQCSEGIGISTAHINFDFIRECRQKMPIQSHRRSLENYY